MRYAVRERDYRAGPSPDLPALSDYATPAAFKAARTRGGVSGASRRRTLVVEERVDDSSSRCHRYRFADACRGAACTKSRAPG